MHIVRKVQRHEYGKYRTHLHALDAESKHLRFGFAIKPEVIDRLCDTFESNPKKHVLFCIENSKLEFVAIGHIALDGEMELAFSVLKDYQGHGMGDALMRRCIQWCRTHHILKGNMVCLSHNARIKHLCLKHHIHIHSEHGETLADIELDKPLADTYLRETADHHMASIDFMVKRALLPWTYTPREA
jgi:GNAT superfamily N-acetyltransferase